MDVVVQKGDGVAAVELGNTLVLLWRAPATMARWEWQLELTERIAASDPKGVVILNFIAASSTPPDAAMRKRMQAYLKVSGGRIRKLIAVPLGDSIWQSIVRAIIRGVALVSGVSDRQIVVGTVPEAIVAAQANGSRASADDLRRAVAQLADALGVVVRTAEPAASRATL
jgi:glycine/D-amino acid oxidase-like deaminating enzyme